MIWQIPLSNTPTVYLTFDDGPHPVVTTFILDKLAEYQAKATFFCIGKNVAAHPDVFEKTKAAGHRVGNHTYNHLNGWTTSVDDYTANILEADNLISEKIFRPPYGRISRKQASVLQTVHHFKIYMWSLLSADFDESISPAKCLNNVLAAIKPGAIVVFHDSAKAWERLRYTLPFVLDYCKAKGWEINAL